MGNKTHTFFITITMDNLIAYYYNLSVDKFKNIDNGLLVESNNNLYIAKEIQNMDNFNQILPNLTSDYYPPLITKEGNYTFNYNGKSYLLFQAINPADKIENHLLNIPVLSNITIDYSKIWENNIDYFIRRITESEDREVDEINYMNYYIGMSENAIAINERAKRINGATRICISHFRIKYPNYSLTYKDPSELMIDYVSRDIAEYTKSKFFYDEMDFKEVIALINRYQLSDKEIMFLIARLMYPNYYFDLLSDKNIEEREIIINKRKSYEKFLLNLLKQIKTTNLFIEIHWLNI
ncbi:MAG: hypothetical protein OSJ65_07145 [Bacilli bacterium]|nr:hypothetical protein [Bacilli bacterium]